MNFLSVCSGIEAASVAWNPLGWKAWGFSEIDKFASAVLAHRYPTTPNLGDMTKFKDWPDATTDLLCGGTPCQSFSNAGLRAGLDDPRGQLMLTFGAVAARYRPRWLVWENVPGVLSSNGGRDFGAFLGLLAHLGYGFAYRVLDAQFVRVDGYPRAVPQRRQRVFVVGCLGDWRSAAAVLLERESLRGDPAPRRKAWQTPAGAAAQLAFGGNNTSGPIDVSTALLAQPGSGWKGDFESGTFIAQPLPFDTTRITSAANVSNPKPGDPCHPLAAGAHPPAIAFPANLSGTQYASTENLSPALGAKNPTAVAIRTAQTGSNGWGVNTEGVAYTLESAQQAVSHGMHVRRLMPHECERLQGFADDYTAIPWRKKPASECPDGPRYKALGNSWAIPPVRWIGLRIAMVDTLRIN